jgi:hypothetical protein
MINAKPIVIENKAGAPDGGPQWMNMSGSKHC